MQFDRVAFNEIGVGVGTIEVSEDEKYPFVLTEPIKIMRVLPNDCHIAEERLLQLAQFMGTLAIDGAKVEEAFRKLLLVAQMHDDFTEYPDSFYKKKKDKPTWSPGFGAPVRRRKK